VKQTQLRGQSASQRVVEYLERVERSQLAEFARYAAAQPVVREVQRFESGEHAELTGQGATERIAGEIEVLELGKYPQLRRNRTIYGPCRQAEHMPYKRRPIWSWVAVARGGRDGANRVNSRGVQKAGALSGGWISDDCSHLHDGRAHSRVCLMNYAVGAFVSCYDSVCALSLRPHGSRQKVGRRADTGA